MRGALTSIHIIDRVLEPNRFLIKNIDEKQNSQRNGDDHVKNCHGDQYQEELRGGFHVACILWALEILFSRPILSSNTRLRVMQ